MKKYIYTLIAIVLGNYSYAITNALKLKVTYGTYNDETIVRFLPNATNGFDGSYDAYKLFSSNSAVPALFTKTSTQNALSINAMPLFTGLISVPINLVANSSGMYSLKSIEVGLFPAGTSFILKDKTTGTYYDFKNGSILNIYVQANILASSEVFELFISPPIQIAPINETCSGLNNGSVNITKQGNTNWSYSITDSLGLTTDSDTNVNITKTVLNLAAGRYILSSFSEFSNTEIDTFFISPGIEVEASFTVTPGVYSTSSYVDFINTSTISCTYKWDFGDNDSSDLYSPTHQYLSAGVYNISLTVNSNGCTSTYNDSLMINDPIITNSDQTSNSFDESYSINQVKNVIKIRSNVRGDYKLNIFSITGEVWFEQTVRGNMEHDITIKQPGIYIINIEGEDYRNSKKIYVNL